MHLAPNLKAVRFQQLPVGDLFICTDHETPCIALKGVDPECDGDIIVLLLGPNLPDGMGLRVIGPRPETVIAIGKDYILRLPIDPNGWKTEVPPNDAPCVALVEDKAFFRGNFSNSLEEFRPCWIEASSGVLRYKPPPGIKAYAVKWEIVIQEPVLKEQMVLRLP